MNQSGRTGRPSRPKAPSRGRATWAALLVALAMVAPGARAATAATPHVFRQTPDTPPAAVARGKKGVVVSNHPAASSAGVSALRAGGNAMDAAVATAFALSVVEQFHSGMGGGGFLLYWDAKAQKATAFDFREVAPKAASRDMYLVKGKVDSNLSLHGMTSVAVPGMVPGLEEAQRRFGRKKLKDVLGPAITLAEEGFLVYPFLNRATAETAQILRANPDMQRIFLDERKEPRAVGERLLQPDLARTLKDLARQGSKLFTEGRIAQAIVKESQAHGGYLTAEDLRSYQPRVREPLSVDYRGYQVLTMPPPSSGVLLLQMLKMHELDLHERQVTGNRMGVEDVHMFLEILRRGYADRAAILGDPAFTDVPVAKLLSDDYVRARYRSIDRSKASPSSGVGGGLEPPLKHTSHLVAIDADGNVATLTQTVNEYFGSGVVVPGTGVILNDEMDDFSAAPGVPNVFGLIGGEANSIAPGKIPASSMSPLLVVKNGKVVLATGAAGGSKIITAVLQIVLNVLDRQMDVARAIAAPRIHFQWKPDEVSVEEGALSPEVKAALEKEGYRLKTASYTGVATALEVYADGTRYGASDPRSNGAPDAE